MSRLNLIWIVVILFSSSISWAAKKVDFNHDKGSIEFVAIGKPSALRIHGVGKPPSGFLKLDKDKISGTLNFDLDSLDTGIKMRNGHMKEKYLEVQKYPQANLAFESLSIPSDLNVPESQSSFPFKGKLTLHGVTKDVSGTAKIKRSGNSGELESRFKILLSDFAIDTPKFMGITVVDTVEVTAKVTDIGFEGE